MEVSLSNSVAFVQPATTGSALPVTRVPCAVTLGQAPQPPKQQRTLSLTSASAAAAIVGTAVASSKRRACRKTAARTCCLALPATVPPAAPATVIVEPDATAVGTRLCEEVAAAAERSINERGAFALAIPGGSILKMLAAGSPKLASVEWDKGVLAYVNHKCVANDDAAATHKKAMDLFLKDWSGLNVITLGGSADGRAEAEKYEEALRALPDSTLPRNADGMPVFDLSLIGVGDDGHFGSLYPGRQEIADESGKWVLPVDMKSPPSITLTPAVVLASQKVLVASAGVSEKYPNGKSEAMRSAIQGEEGPGNFPAQILRGKAEWLFDVPAASALSSEYV
eukprot:TRINITY_DN113241_c0_g1_i1.p1 TRINITY_DN113241_c0_g1~~TRINITY_DN113241_c0_g1_i1.p1  ORF type:complete len:339 (+),score=75.36 TRINITY_DN113241_c0_g1_i1:64-1080(+)